MAKVKDYTQSLEAFVKRLPAFEGFTGTWYDDKDYVLNNAAGDIRFEFHPGGDGTTSFKAQDGNWLTFDRRGVDSSFYWRAFDYKGAGMPDIKEVIAEQLTRIATSREFQKFALKIPQIGHSISPVGLERLKEEFRKNDTASRSFHPAGFGTGYTVSRTRSRFATRATKALEDFIGVSPLYVSTFDAD